MVGLQGLWEINLQANILSEFIKHHIIQSSYQLGLTINSSTWKGIFRSIIVFLDMIVDQVGPQQELITSEEQEQKG